VYRYRLDNGLTVLMAPNRAAPVVALQAWVGVGAADETRDVHGIAHVFEHMLFKGTAQRGVGEIAQHVEAAGGEINAWTTFNQTVYHVVLASRYFDTGLDVLADALQHSAFDAGELEREREVILEEIRQGQDDPGRNVAQALFATAYARHPYRRPVIGSVESVQSLTRDRLVEFFRTWYVANNTTLVVAGDFEPEPTRQAIAGAFRGQRSAEVPRRRHHEPRQTRARAAVVTQDVREAQFAVGFHIPEMRSRETAALDVLAVALGQGESSRLSATVRRRDELVSAVYAYAHSLRDPGLFVIGATMQPDNVDAALGATLEQTFRLAHEPVDDAEIEKARRVIEADTIYQEETAQGAARKYGFYHLVAGDADYEHEYLSQVRATTASDVRDAAVGHLDVDNMTVAALLPNDGRETSDRARVAREAKLLAVAGKTAAKAAKTYKSPVPAAAQSDVVRDVLPNGMRIIIKRDASVPIVAMRAVWIGGARYESATQSGITHLLASMMTRGCGGRSADELAVAVDDMAGVLSGFSGRNSFGIRSEWLSEDWEAGFALTAECILDPEIPHAEFLRERRRHMDELEARADSPSYVAFRLFANTLYRKHPYRRDVLGTAGTVGKISRKQLAGYYARIYPVSAMTLAVVGDVDPERVLRQARDTFGAVNKRTRRERKFPEEDFSAGGKGPREAYRFLDRQQAHMVVGFPGTTVDDADRFPLEVLTTILSGQGGRLFLELRDRQSLAYRVGAFSIEGIDPGYLAVYIACAPDKLTAALTGIKAELQALVDEKVDPEELERAIRYLIGTHDISLQRRSAVASAIAFHEAYGLGYDEYARYATAIETVTREDVQRVAAAYIDWDTAVIATVKPEQLSPGAARRARGVKSQKKKKKKERGPNKPKRKASATP
jgi:zinc protease